MQVRIRVLGSLREMIPKNNITLDLEGDVDMERIIKEIIGDNTQLESSLWDPVTESYSPNALILVNGVEAENLEGLKTKIVEGAEIVLLSVTHGG